MLKLAAAGSLDYLEMGVEALSSAGYSPEFVIERSSRNDDSIENHLEAMKKAGIDLLVCLAYPEILKKEVLDSFPKGCINLHAGLPAYRGRHPLNWMIIDGVQEIPVSVHYMDPGIDTGPVITHDTVLLERDDNYSSVLAKVTGLEKNLLVSAVKQIDSGSVYSRNQHPELLRYTRRRTPGDSELDLTQDSAKVHNFIRALTDPMPNAFMDTSKGRINFKGSYIGSDAGQVLAKTEDGRYVISTRDGVVLVETDRDLNAGDNLLK